MASLSRFVSEKTIARRFSFAVGDDRSRAAN
jgi:hypothetical protein